MQFEIKEIPYGERLIQVLLIARFEKRAHFYTSIKTITDKVDEAKLNLKAMAVAWRLNRYIKHRVAQYGNNPEGKAYCEVSALQIKQADSLQHIFGLQYTARGLARVVVMQEASLRSVMPDCTSKFYESSSKDLNAIITWAHENK